MDVNLESILDSLTSFIRAVAEDGRLRDWFLALEQKSERERRAAILAMTRRMSAYKENHDLVTSLRLLAAPRIFEAARVTIRSRRY